MGVTPANFERVIRKSGLSKKEIAARKKVKPETLSRHLSGAIRMTLDDAHDYADILGCTPLEVFFPLEEAPIIIHNYIQGSPEYEQVFKTSFERVLNEKPEEKLYLPTHFGADLALCVYTARDDYDGPMKSMHQTLDVIYQSPIREGRVHPLCNQKLSYVCLKNPEEHEGVRDNGKIRMMQVFPQPNNKYTLHNIITGTTNEGVELEWATPTLTQVHCPEAFFTLDQAQWS